jgi:Bifunctional DNA primase/polymerase, N-terminal
MSTLASALAWAGAGYLVFPCKPLSKEPATVNGCKDATVDAGVITSWFGGSPSLNVAVACGPQPNGVNLLVVDIDGHHGGLESWRGLVAANDGRAMAGTTVCSTPHDGFHIWLDAPSEFRNSRNRLGPGIDTRGAGGYVVVPPSRLVDGVYGGGVGPVKAAPGWVVEALAPRLVVVPAPAPVWHPSMGNGFSAFDWVREHASWPDVLARHDWAVHSNGGGDVNYTRPGKAVRDGKSAVLHASGAFVVFSTEVPASLEGLGTPTVDGTGFSVSLPDFVCAYEFGGDRALMARVVFERYGPGAPVAGGSSRTAGGVRAADAVPDQGTPEPPPLNLASEFWGRRPVLGHILVAARAAACSPDALLIHALARTATFLPPCFKLPGVEQGVIGKAQTLDFLGCVVAETSGGKTLAAGVGELLVPAPEPPADGSDPLIDFEQKVGSGEGIAEFFLVPELRPDDESGKLKPTGRRVVGKQALFMSVDEGTGFTNQAGRKGTTIVATLASAWSGESLGQLNAAAETRRLVQGGRVRICAVINMQDSNAYKLYTDDLESVGFTGRLLFASAHDASAPAAMPEWPGRLTFPVWPTGLVNKFFTYDASIVDEIRSTRHAILTKRLVIDRRQSQYLLLRCKVAAILASWEDRLAISVDDWALATEVVSMSANLLTNLDHYHRNHQHVTAVTATAQRKIVDREAQEMADLRFVATKATKLLKYIPADGIAPSKLRKRLHSNERSLWNALLNHAVEHGVWRVEDGRIHQG